MGRLVLRRWFGRAEAGRGRSRAGRRAGQQCRHHPRRPVPSDDPGAVERRHQHQSEFAVQYVPAGDRGHAGAQIRPHRQCLLDQWPEGPVRPVELFRRQGRRSRLHQGPGAGRRARRHHRQCDLPRLYQHGNGAGGAEG
ncbi:unnamed protein product, partial [Phaeothamnion confervicola]